MTMRTMTDDHDYDQFVPKRGIRALGVAGHSYSPWS